MGTEKSERERARETKVKHKPIAETTVSIPKALYEELMQHLAHLRFKEAYATSVKIARLRGE